MRLPPFQYLEPTNVEEALSMLSTNKETAQIMSGGTDLLNRMKLRIIEPACVMSIGKLRNIVGIEKGGAETVIGASTCLKEIAGSSLVNEKYKAVAAAAFQVASPTITNMATIGGNILQNTRCLFYNQSAIVLNGLERCHKRGGNICLAVKGSKRCFSVYQGDMAPALIAFDAKCVLEKNGSSRTVLMAELFTGNGAAPFSIGNDELLTKIIIPQPKGIYSSAFRKLRLRGSIDYPLASAAAFISVTADMKVTACRVVIGAAGAAPKVVDRASSTVKSNLPSEADVEDITRMAYEHAEGADNLLMPGAYRRKMASVMAKRALKAAIDGIKEGM